MGEAFFQSLQVLRRERVQPRALPLGCGLLIGASISIGLWGLIIWGVVKAFGWVFGG